MSTQTLTEEHLTAYVAYLHAEERSPGTIENYLRHVTMSFSYHPIGKKLP